MKYNIDYLNTRIRNKDNFVYDGPKSLYKYRPFDNFTFDMFDNEYVYLCPAEKLDDPSECMTELDISRLYDFTENNLKRECVEQIIDMLKPYSTEETHNQTKTMIKQIMKKDGTVPPNLMLDLSMVLQDRYPNINLAPFVNYIRNIPELLDKPYINEQFKTFFSVAIDARQKLGICSLCETSDNNKLWELYANNDTGYCVEYDISDYELNKEILPVVYQDDRNCNIIMQLVNMFINDMISNFSNGKIETDISQYLRLFVTKNLIWEYQQEWRLIGNAGEKAKAPKIKSIYLGLNVSEENENKVREFFEIIRTKQKC